MQEKDKEIADFDNQPLKLTKKTKQDQGKLIKDDFQKRSSQSLSLESIQDETIEDLDA